MLFSFEIKVTKDSTVKRVLDRYGVSHRLFMRLRDAKMIMLDGETVANVPVHAGQRVSFVLPAAEQDAVVPSAAPLAVVVDNPNWLIVDKPAGLSSVPGPSSPDDSVLNRAANYLLATGITAPQPAIITRLDRDTTGLMLIAKHPFAQGRLDRLGVSKVVTKRYYALAGGQMPELSGVISAPLAPAADGIRQAVTLEGKKARTDYRVLQRGQNCTLLECTLRTGRTHQIRVHMASCGHPLVGDELYGGDTSVLHEQALVAAKLSFVDPFSGHKLAAELPVPEAMKQLVGEEKV
ncbi:RluA family pseudouridine synthase [Lacticaseibacillus zhaodongensis]|uniref:RluA family pseudouridine synthase n=1 Tax=Lacticaseibacillus zhaodongensis TaxID=2668065 RepID=UPI0012D2FB0E|nr:RluA family pseudouridine synthase [Lacticaseibacillus zhaodongensis]